jgi:hypothetical protein
MSDAISRPGIQFPIVVSMEDNLRTVPDLDRLDSLPNVSPTEHDPFARHNLHSSSSRGASASRTAQARDPDHSPVYWPMHDQGQHRSNTGAPVQVLHPFPTGSSFEPAVLEMSSAKVTQLSSRTSEEWRQQAEHLTFTSELFNCPDGLSGAPLNEHSAFMQMSTRLLCTLQTIQSRSKRDALSAAAATLDSLASVRATNEVERRNFKDLFNSANSAFFAELRMVIATEATSRQQDQVDFRAGMEELRILQLEAAANTARLFEFQETALDGNQRIGEVQEQAMANNERLADLIRNQNTAATSNLSPEDLPVSRSEFVLMFEELKTHITSHLCIEELKTHITSHLNRNSPAPPNGECPNTQLNTLTTLCHDMGLQLEKII